MKKTVAALTAFLLLFLLSPAFAATPLVTVEWLLANAKDPDLVVLDLQPPQGYQRAHFPGAVSADYGRWRTSGKGGKLKVMPPVEQMEKLIGGLGIDNNTQVVLTPLGQGAGDMASAARIYWTFKALGHDKVSILDGGLVGYAQGGRNRPLERKANRPQPKNFKAAPRKEYLLTKDDVRNSLMGGVTMVDSRSRAEFLGIYQGGGKERPGTIPGSVNLPYDWVTVNGGAGFHSPEDLRAIYRSAGVPLEGPQISFCRTGHRTALSWFVSHELLGNKKAQMYDGSMQEWAADSSTPLEQEVELECKSC